MEKRLNGGKYFLLGLLIFAAVLVFVCAFWGFGNFAVSNMHAKAAEFDPIIVTEPVSYSGTYDGHDKELILEVAFADGTETLEYSWYAKLSGQTIFSIVAQGSINQSDDTNENGNYDCKYEFDGYNDNGNYYCEIVARDTNSDIIGSIASNTVTVTVYKRAIYATINNLESFYGEPIEELTFTITGGEFANGDTINDVGIVLTKAAGFSAGTYIISGTNNAENYAVFFTNGSYTIKPKNVRIIIANRSSVYGEALQALTYTLYEGDTLAGEEDIEDLNITLTKSEGTVAGRYPISGEYDNNNYNVTFIPGEYTITKRPLMVSFENYEDIVYNGQIQSIGAFILGSPLLNDTVAVSVQYNKTPKNAGTYSAKAILSNGNYAIVGGDTKQFVINKKTLKISLVDLVINKGDTPQFSYQYTGFVEGEKVDDLATLPTVEVQDWDIGDYELTPFGAVSSNYEFEYVKGLLRINKREMTALGGVEAKAKGSFSPEAGISVTETSAAVFSKIGSFVAAEYNIEIDGDFYGGAYKLEIKNNSLNKIFMRAVIIDAEGKMHTLRNFDYTNGVLYVETGSQGTLVIYNDYIVVGVIVAVVVLVMIILLIFIGKDRKRYNYAKKVAAAAAAQAEYYRRLSEED